MAQVDNDASVLRMHFSLRGSQVFLGQCLLRARNVRAMQSIGQVCNSLGEGI